MHTATHADHESATVAELLLFGGFEFSPRMIDMLAILEWLRVFTLLRIALELDVWWPHCQSILIDWMRFHPSLSDPRTAAWPIILRRSEY